MEIKYQKQIFILQDCKASSVCFTRHMRMQEELPI